MTKLKVKDRIKLEKEFLSAVLAAANKGKGDIREKMARYQANWRQFRDKRHRAIWRALEALNLRDRERREEILQDEWDTWDDTKTLGVDYFPVEMLGDNEFRERYLDELEEKSRGLAWLERELDAAGAMGAVGGKKYLREVAAAYPVTVDTVAEGLARQLGFM